MATLLKDLRTLFSSRSGEVERKAAEFKLQREKRAADFAAGAAREKETPEAPGAGVVPGSLVELAGELAEKTGLGTRAETRELAARLGRHLRRLFS